MAWEWYGRTNRSSNDWKHAMRSAFAEFWVYRPPTGPSRWGSSRLTTRKFSKPQGKIRWSCSSGSSSSCTWGTFSGRIPETRFGIWPSTVFLSPAS
eukprot:12345670-Alexandrium_andersonii.AAC.1